MAVPGLKVVAPSSAADVKGLARCGDPRSRPGDVLRSQGALPDQGRGARRRTRRHAGHGQGAAPRQGLHDPRARRRWCRARVEAAERLAREGIDATVVDVRSLVPLDTQTILRETIATGRLFTVEENPRLCGWGAEIASIVAEEASTISTGRSCASRRRTSRCPRPTRSKTWRGRRSSASYDTVRTTRRDKDVMTVGMVGLGEMGSGFVERLLLGQDRRRRMEPHAQQGAIR